MSRAVEWLPRAFADLMSVTDYRVAEAVDAAVDRYAAEGVGFVVHVEVADGPDEFRLLIPRMRTYVLIRRTATTLYVERVVVRL